MNHKITIEDVDLRKLQESTIKYQDLIVKNTNQTKSKVSYKAFQDLFESGLESIIISNYIKPKETVYFLLKLTSTHIELLERNNTSRNVIYLDLDSKKVTLNGIERDTLFLNKLDIRIKQIINQLKVGKARVYEEFL